ncbi:hypothetical protein BDD12DRAFT_871095 [Trichophaea hybrida]|nr:hypothetical protein BDD12DRAFT_871095 [Trichophaea hybrida]
MIALLWPNALSSATFTVLGSVQGLRHFHVVLTGEGVNMITGITEIPGVMKTSVIAFFVLIILYSL